MFDASRRYAVFEVIDWYNNQLIKGIFEMHMHMGFKSREAWITFFTERGFNVKQAEFHGFPEQPFSPKLPLGIFVLEKPGSGDPDASSALPGPAAALANLPRPWLNSDRYPDGTPMWPGETLGRRCPEQQIPELIRLNEFASGSPQHEALIALQAEMLGGGPIQLLPAETEGAARWNALIGPYASHGWLGAVPFALAESYFYRRVLEATRPVDPYVVVKAPEWAATLEQAPAARSPSLQGPRPSR